MKLGGGAVGVKTRSDSDGFLSIQALRGVAALSVAAYHAAILAGLIGPLGSVPDMHVVAAGVDIFFVISGFIMVYACEPLFAERGAPQYFLLRRIARIVPLYWAASGILLFIALTRWPPLAEANASPEWLVASFLFIPYPRPDGLMEPLLNLGWTLNYEMFFYVIFAIALVGTRRAAVFGVATFFVSLVVAGVAFAPRSPILAFWSNPIILEFVFGMAIALAYREGVRLGATAYVLIASGLAGYLLSATLGSDYLPRIIAWGVPSACIVGAFALMRTPPAPNPFWRSLGFLGDASYAIYLIHPLVYLKMRTVVAAWIDVAFAPWTFMFALFAAAILSGILIHRLFERPLIRALRQRLDGFSGGRRSGVAARPRLSKS